MQYSIPKELVSDNGPQFVSAEFCKFTQTWGIQHTPTSPYNSKANGKVVSAVKAAKHKLCKTTKSGEDQSLLVEHQKSSITTCK